MGMRPRGEGEREMVRQYEEAEEAAEEGERWPFSAAVPLGGELVDADAGAAGGFLGRGGDCAMLVTMDLGLRLRARARSSSNLEDSVLRLVRELPMGAK